MAATPLQHVRVVISVFNLIFGATHKRDFSRNQYFVILRLSLKYLIHYLVYHIQHNVRDLMERPFKQINQTMNLCRLHKYYKEQF